MPTALINGINYSSVDVQCVMLGTIIVGITHVKCNKKQDKKNNYALGKKVVSRGYGKEEYDASVDFYIEELLSIADRAPNGNILEIPPFDITLLLGQGLNVRRKILRLCEFLEDPFEVGEGDTRIVVSVPILPADIL